MDCVENASQSGAVVYMDGKLFVNCVFTGCQMVYAGGDFGWRNTKFDNCEISLEGSAKRTAEFLGHFNLFRPEVFKKPAPPPSPSTKSIQ